MTSNKLDHCLSLLQQNEGDLKLLLEISQLYLELEDLEQAQVYLTKAKQIDRQSCLSIQGILNLKQGDTEKAKEHFLEALEQEKTAELKYNLAFTYYIDNNYEQAWSTLSDIRESEAFSDIPLLKARILQQQNKSEQAIELLEAQIKQNSDDAEALSFLSLLYFDNNDEASAAEFCQRALALNSELYDARLVDIMLRLLNQETHVDEIESLIKINPEDSRLWFALGSTYMGQGEFSLAEPHLARTLEMHPEFYDCHIALAWCQLLNNNIQEAHKTYQNAISVVDNLADGWGGLAIIYALNADLEQAAQLINKANSLNADCFLTEIAQIIYLTYKNPQESEQSILHALLNPELAASEKLAFIMSELC